MKPQILLLSFLFNIISLSATEIDATTSSIKFEVNSFGFGTVKGNFQSFTGDILWNESDLTASDMSFSIESNSVTAKSNRRTKFIKGEEFFNVNTFPAITFSASEIVSVENGYLGPWKYDF